jgi:hypothetical protein
MSILWKSFEEYKDYVNPNSVNENIFRFRHVNSWFEHHQDLFEAVEKLHLSIDKLAQMGFDDEEPNGEKLVRLEDARSVVLDIAYAGETLLLYHQRLAKSQAAYDFLHQKDLDEHWDRYSTSNRIFHELYELIVATKTLLEAYSQIVLDDSRFLLADIDLPKELETDFVLARDLFSVGFEDIGLLIAGRGLEGVLRSIAKKKRIKIAVRGRDTPAHEADFYDLIETLSRVRWQKDKSRLIGMDVKTLLHFLRTVRNSGAHPTSIKGHYLMSPREMAKVVAQVAHTLWEQITVKRARLESSIITKDW